MERYIVVVQRSVSDNTPFSWVVVQDVIYQLIPIGSRALVLEAAATFRPDLFLIEHDPPILDGIALCHQLHAQPGQEDVPTMVVAHNTTFPEDCFRIDVPYVRYLNEPFELSRLLGQAEHLGLMPGS